MQCTLKGPGRYCLTLMTFDIDCGTKLHLKCMKLPNGKCMSGNCALDNLIKPSHTRDSQTFHGMSTQKTLWQICSTSHNGFSGSGIWPGSNRPTEAYRIALVLHYFHVCPYFLYPSSDQNQFACLCILHLIESKHDVYRSHEANSKGHCLQFLSPKIGGSREKMQSSECRFVMDSVC